MTIAQVARLRNIPAESRGQLDEIVHVTLRDFHVGDGQRADAGSISCGASVDMSLSKKAGGAYESRGLILPFVIHLAENGQVITIGEADIASILSAAAASG